MTDSFYGTREEARSYDLEQRRAFRKNPIAASSQFNSLLPDFVASYRLDHLPQGVERTMRSLDILSRFFGRHNITSITPGMVEEYKRLRLEEGVKPVTVNKELCALSTLLKWAAENDYCEPPARVKKFPGKVTKSPVPVVPPGNDFERIIEHMDPRTRGLAMLMFYCGLRRNEALHLQAEDVLLERRLLIVRGKGNKQRIVPLQHPELIEELKKKLEEVKSGVLWISPYTGESYKDIRDGMKAAAKRAGVGGRVYNHLLRHGFGTTATESGISLRSVQELMGHSTSQVTELYTHIAAAHLTREMKKFKPVTNKDDDKPAE